MMAVDEKQQAFSNLRRALLSGNYAQGKGALCRRRDDGSFEYCAVGVLDEVCLGTSWFYYDNPGKVLCDVEGEASMVDNERVAFMGLDQYITDQEAQDLAEMWSGSYTIFDDDEFITRIEAIQLLSDMKLSFENILWDVIERYGWDG